jgi:hypothetical protein
MAASFSLVIYTFILSQELSVGVCKENRRKNALAVEKLPVQIYNIWSKTPGEQMLRGPARDDPYT